MAAEQAKYSTVVIGNMSMAGGLQKLVEDLNPLKVYELFRRVSSEVSCEEGFVMRCTAHV